MKIFGYEIKRAPARGGELSSAEQAYFAMLYRHLIKGVPIPISDTPRAYITEAYLRNPTVYSIIMMRANAAKSVPWLVYRKKNKTKFQQYKNLTTSSFNFAETVRLKNEALEEVEKTPLNDLLVSPNPHQTFPDIIEELFVHRDTTGNAYIYMPINEYTHLPISFHVAPTEKIRIIGGTFTEPIAGYTFVGIEGEISPKNIIHWKYLNPLASHSGEGLYGTSPLRPAVGIVMQDNYAIDGQTAAFFNEGLKGIITGTEQTVIEFSEAQALKMQEKFQKSTGYKNRNKVQFNRAPLNFVKIGETPADLETLEARRANKENLCNIFRIHPALLSSEASTLNNLREARKMLMTTSVLPDLDSLKAHLNARVAALFGAEFWIDYDLMAIKELQADLTELAKMLHSMEWITDNEKRAATQYDRYDDPAADQLYKPAGLIPLGMEFDTGFERIDAELEKTVRR